MLVGAAEDDVVIEDYRDAVQSAFAPIILASHFLDGSARMGATIPDATHTTILYEPQTADVIAHWLDATLDASNTTMRAPLKTACWLTLVVSGARLIGICA